MKRKQHYMTEGERNQLEAMYRNKISVAEIARQLGFTRQTIYNELRRGSYWHTMDYRDVKRYSAEKGQSVRLRGAAKKGRKMKIAQDPKYAAFLERKILREKYSPAAAIAAGRRAGYQTAICVNTLYSYVSKRVFSKLRDIDLPEKVSRKRKKNKEARIAHPELPSIEQRPSCIGQRSELGHWEMDLIIGKVGKSALLTMTERVSRREIIIKIPDKRAASVRKAIDRIERRTPNFKEIFKSITTDNGSEFMEYDLLQQSCRRKGKRFDIYYCHSFSAWEKGTNENHNRMIRRWFPKGTDFDKVKPSKIKAVENWMNSYPRKLLGWKTPQEINLCEKYA